ncbi:MAG: hypothetical protein AABW59_05260 [archaeon]
MIQLVLNKAIQEYKENFPVVLSLGALLLFLAVFVMFEQFVLTSGTVLLTFNTDILALIGLAAGIIFLYALSFFSAVVIFGVRRDVQHFSLDVYWNTIMKSAAVKIFLMYLFLSIVVYLLVFSGLFYGYEFIAILLALIISCIVMYAPQSIVLDEETVFGAVAQSIKFWQANFSLSAVIVLISAVLLAVIMVVELVLDLLSVPGVFVSIALVLLFLLPFIEQMKSYAFVLKFALIRTSEVHQAGHKAPKPVKIDATRMRERHRGGKL